jgi:hypothetical protein
MSSGDTYRIKKFPYLSSELAPAYFREFFRNFFRQNESKEELFP